MYSHCIPVDCTLPSGPLWKLKHNCEELSQIERSNSYVYNAQYLQNPSPKGGNLFKEGWWKYYTVLPILEYKIIVGDTAQEVGKHNDFTVFQSWGVAGGCIYLIDQFRDKLEAPELTQAFISFWHKHRDQCRSAHIEKKSSGSSLIQTIQRDERIPIFPIERNVDKISRAYNTSPYIESGYVYLPEEAPFLFDYIEEHKKFTPLLNHKHDDQIDPTMDAIELLLIEGRYDDITPDMYNFTGKSIAATAHNL